ncbi:serine hydrolase domain-containing protein [Bacillus sp. 31A1R]|uniref:Serine hydrolase domain-containing protein n=1 Tax=Robertmurraya mangrovi TaxID=3098077 RepID=A0ABU5IWA0_9BACI|nr:serine hydrolase domain-containing protein [Bacillus sp. 31A1R]MDZ5471439.1 serine hydrolase domain-containing protein [Bacillus sp. 31A1R]
MKNIESMINKYMQENQVPGTAVTIIKEKQVWLSKGFGKTNVEEWGADVSEQTLFRIASVSKLLTGTMIMMLVEKGLIDLDEPIRTYVPWFTTDSEEYSKLVTMRMLLCHSTGLPTGGLPSGYKDEKGLYLYMKEVVPTLTQHFYPGTAYSYSNHGVNIAGFVAETVTQKPFATLMEELIYKPLEMKQTTYSLLKAATYPLALPHNKDAEGNLQIIHELYENTSNYPCSYAYSSIKDLSNFAMLHLNNGLFNGKRLLEESSIEEMRTMQAKWYNKTNGGCGISFFQEVKDGIKRFWHYGQFNDNFTSQFILVPEKGMAVIVLANGDQAFQLGYDIVDELLKDEKVEKEDWIQVTDRFLWKDFEGTYLHGYWGIMEISNGYLKHNDNKYELIPFNDDSYIAINENGDHKFIIGFPELTPDQQKVVMINSRNCSIITLGYQPNPSDWENLEGAYSDEIETYKVWIKDSSTLMIKDYQTGQDIEAQAILSNQFLTKEYGHVGFIEINGVMNIEFDFAWRNPRISNEVFALN